MLTRRHARAAGLAAVGSALAAPALARTPLVRLAGWQRTNFRGADVTLAGGVAAALAATLAAAGSGGTPGRAPGLVAAAALAGAYDDLLAPTTEIAGDKGFAGHLSAVRSGRVSGGVVKVVVIGGAAWWASGPAATSWPDRLIRTVAVAGSANLVNLFDLRPGRAAKVVLVAATALVGGATGPLATAAAVAAAAALPGDLGERTMLGDTGAGALGALLGLRVASGSRALAIGAAGATTALAALSEKVSFSAVIERRPVLRRVDQLGRRP